MTSHDTDPDNTIPSPPEGSSGGEGGERAVESLLADLARAPLPVEGVSETSGQMAAAVAIGPHRPPRATEGTDLARDPAVVLNTTEPLAAAVPALPPPQTNDTTRDIEPPRPYRAAAVHTTTPSKRVRSTRMVYLAFAAAAALGLGTGVAVLLQRPASPSIGGTAPRDPAQTASATANANANANATTSTVPAVGPIVASTEPAASMTKAAPDGVQAPHGFVRAPLASASTPSPATPPPSMSSDPVIPSPPSSGAFPWRQ